MRGKNLMSIDGLTDITEIVKNNSDKSKRSKMAEVFLDDPDPSGDSRELDDGTYIVYDSALGTVPIAAVSAFLDGSLWKEWCHVDPAKSFPFKPSATNGTVRFRRVADAQKTVPAFETWLQNNGATYGVNFQGAVRRSVSYTVGSQWS